MTTRTVIAALAAAATAATALTTAAATPAAAASPRSEAVAAAKGHVRSAGAALGYADGQSLVVRDVVLDARGSHVRLDRTFRGLPVLGGDLVVHQGAGRALRGTDRASTAVITLRDLAPRVTAARAAEIGARELTDGQVATATPTLSVDATSRPALVWDVLVDGVRADQTPAELHVVVDATDGTVVRSWDGVRHATGTGNGFFSGTVALETTPISGGYSLTDPTRGNQYTVDMNNRQGGKATLFTDADNVWGTGSLSNRQTTAVDAQYGTAKTWDYYQTTFGRSGIANDGKGAYNRVHYGKNYNNAFWSDSCFCMTYGDGDGTTFNPFDSLDVAGHEMTHGVTSRTANLTYSGESGGLNEATSDIFGTLVEFFANNPNDAPDYQVGEELYRSGTQALRYMYHPSLDGRSANCWSSSLGTLDVHYSSGVANHFFYLLAEGSNATPSSPTCNGSSVVGIGRSAAGAIWYRALTVYMTSSTNYAGARTATLNAARDLYGSGSAQQNAVAAAWSAVSVG